MLREWDITETSGVVDKCVQIWTRKYGALGHTARVCIGDEKTRERSPALDGEKGKSPALDRESMRGEPWLERTGRER
ncbi:hypothetical protein TNCV_4890152 [Trichonephila clavipes]|nr:hypothetical protein TNCV_4890152 [Trichonephila clavipes]